MDPQIVYGLAFACMELGNIDQAKEHFIRVLEIEAPEDLRGLENHVLRALPERVTFLRWSLLCVWQDGRLHRGLLFHGAGVIYPTIRNCGGLLQDGHEQEADENNNRLDCWSKVGSN